MLKKFSLDPKGKAMLREDPHDCPKGRTRSRSISTSPVACASRAHARLSPLMAGTVAGDLTNVAGVLNWTHSRVYSLEPGDYGMRREGGIS